MLFGKGWRQVAQHSRVVFTIAPKRYREAPRRRAAPSGPESNTPTGSRTTPAQAVSEPVTVSGSTVTGSTSTIASNTIGGTSSTPNIVFVTGSKKTIAPTRRSTGAGEIP